MPEDYEDEYCRFIDDYPETRPETPAPEQPLWVVHMGHQGIGGDRGRAEGFLCVGWQEVGNLKGLGSKARVKAAIRNSNPEKVPATITRWTNEAFDFSHGMKTGELVIHPVKNTDVVKIGTVAGEYRFAGDDQVLVESDSVHVLPVKWLRDVSRDALSEDFRSRFGRQFVVRNFPADREEIVKLVSDLGVT